jgi:hypothetical protein
MERGVTDDHYTDGRVPLVKPSVIILPTEFIPVTDGISPLVKLFNDVMTFILSDDERMHLNYTLNINSIRLYYNFVVYL